MENGDLAFISMQLCITVVWPHPFLIDCMSVIIFIYSKAKQNVLSIVHDDHKNIYPINLELNLVFKNFFCLLSA